MGQNKVKVKMKAIYRLYRCVSVKRSDIVSVWILFKKTWTASTAISLVW